MTRSLRQRLEDLRRGCDACLELAKRGELAVVGDSALLDAMTYRLMIIGEAVASLRRDHPDLTTRSPHIPWKEFVGLRDIVVHQYFRVSSQVLWATVRDELPPLREFVVGALAQLDGEAPPELPPSEDR